MNLIKPYTKKLLKDLDDISLWENSFFTIRHIKDEFEIWTDFGYWACINELIFNVPLKFNVLEAFLITRKASKIKRFFVNSVKPIPKYFTQL